MILLCHRLHHTTISGKYISSNFNINSYENFFFLFYRRTGEKQTSFVA